MSPGIRFCAALLAAGLSALLVTCKGKSAQSSAGKEPGPIPGSSRVNAPLQAPAAPSAALNPTCPPLTAPPPSGTRILVDISGSMQGFASAKSPTLELLHTAFDRAVSEVKANSSIKRCLVGDDFDQCKGEYPDYKVFNRKDFYHSQSLLHLGLVPPSPVDGCPQIDPMDTSELNILLTDGVQVASQSVPADSGSSSAACVRGADPDCLRSVLINRIRQGFGLWIAIGYFEFNGLHFPEQPIREQDWALWEDHRLKLRVDPLFQGKVEFKARKPALPTKAENGYGFTGVKPLIFIVMTRQVATGRAFMAALNNELHRSNLLVPADSFFLSEIAPLDLPKFAISGAARGKPSSVQGGETQFGNPDEIRVEPARQARFDVYEIQTKCTIKGGAWFSVTARQTGGSAVPGILTGIELAPFDYAPPEKVFYGWYPLGGGSFYSGLSCLNLTPGAYRQVWLLQARHKMDPAHRPWWIEYAAENTFEKPERVYGLMEVVSGLLEEVIVRPSRQQYLTWTMTRE